MERYIETFFRHKLLFIVILIVVPTLGAGYAVDRNQVLYQSNATVWAERPAFLQVVGSWNIYLTPSQIQQGNVEELLQTQNFDMRVLNNTDLRNKLQSRAGLQKTILDLRQRTVIYPNGTHVVIMSYSDTSPKVAAQVVAAIITEFNKEIITYVNSQSSIALAFYQKQLDAANVKLAQSTAALRAYLDQHPEIGSVPSAQRTLSLVADATFQAKFPEAVKLIDQRAADAKEQQTLQASYNNIQFTQNSAVAGGEQQFKIMDAPSIPLHPVSTKRKLAMELGLSGVAALGFCAVGLVFLTLLDGTFRSPKLTAARLNLPVYGSVPLVRQRRALFRRRRVVQHDVRGLLAIQAQHPDFRQLRQTTTTVR